MWRDIGDERNRGRRNSELPMLEDLLNQKIVVDMATSYVCLGTLLRFDDHFLELKNADLHDLRDTDTTRENYVAASRATGIKRNRKRVLVNRDEIVALSRLDDVTDD
jgi:hypothetical protein